MKLTGIVRSFDKLGRVVIPKEMRTRIFNENDEIEIFATEDSVVIKPGVPKFDTETAPVIHAKWKRCFEDWRKQIEGDECSACGFQHYGASISCYNFCPNCGAKMDAKE